MASKATPRRKAPVPARTKGAKAKAAPPAKPPKPAAKREAMTTSKPGAATGKREAVGKKAAKALAAPAVPKPKKVRAKKLPPRMRVRWCVYDASMKPVALFDYKHKAAAQASLAQHLEKKPNYFLQLIKEPLPVAVEPAAVK